MYPSRKIWLDLTESSSSSTKLTSRAKTGQNQPILFLLMPVVGAELSADLDVLPLVILGDVDEAFRDHHRIRSSESLSRFTSTSIR